MIAIVLMWLGVGGIILYFKEKSKKDVSIAVHNWTQHAYDSGFLTEEAVNMLKDDVNSGGYGWKLKEIDS